MKNIYDKEKLLLLYNNENFRKEIFTNDALVLSEFILSEKGHEPDSYKQSGIKLNYNSHYYIDEHAGLRGTSNTKYISKCNTINPKRDTSSDMSWRKGSGDNTKIVQSNLNIIKLPIDRKTSNEFNKGLMVEETKSTIPEESKKEERFDIKIIYKINEYMKYPNHEPLWYILHPVAKSSFGPLSSLNIEEMWNNKVVNITTEIRFIDIFHIRNKLPFVYFKLNEIEDGDFIERIELNPLISSYSHIGKKIENECKSPMKEILKAIHDVPINNGTAICKSNVINNNKNNFDNATKNNTNNVTTSSNKAENERKDLNADQSKNGVSANKLETNKLTLLFGSPNPVKTISSGLKIQTSEGKDKKVELVNKTINSNSNSKTNQPEFKKSDIEIITTIKNNTTIPVSDTKPEIERCKQNNTIEIIKINSRAHSNFRKNNKRGKSKGKLVDIDVALGKLLLTYRFRTRNSKKSNFTARCRKVYKQY